MKSISTAINSLILLGITSMGLVAMPQESEETNTKAAAVKGKVLVQTACTACHSLMVIQNANKNSVSWKKTLEKMTQQGMPKLPAAFESSMIEFLTQNHGEKKVEARENKGPWGDRRNANPLW